MTSKIPGNPYISTASLANSKPNADMIYLGNHKQTNPITKLKATDFKKEKNREWIKDFELVQLNSILI